MESYLEYDLAAGGFNYNMIDGAKLPADFIIDYVRAWPRKDLASPENGPKASTSPKAKN